MILECFKSSSSGKVRSTSAYFGCESKSFEVIQNTTIGPSDPLAAFAHASTTWLIADMKASRSAPGLAHAFFTLLGQPNMVRDALWQAMQLSSHKRAYDEVM